MPIDRVFFQATSYQSVDSIVPTLELVHFTENKRQKPSKKHRYS